MTPEIIMGINLIIVNIIVIILLWPTITLRLIYGEPSRNAILWAAGRVYYDYLDKMKVTNPYGREEILPPAIKPNSEKSPLSIRVYTTQELKSFIKQFTAALFTKNKVWRTTHEVMVRNNDYLEDGVACFKHMTIIISTKAQRVIRRKMLILSIVGHEYLLDPNEFLRFYVLDTNGFIVRAYDIDSGKLICIRFTEGDSHIDIDFDEIVDVVDYTIPEEKIEI